MNLKRYFEHSVCVIDDIFIREHIMEPKQYYVEVQCLNKAQRL